MLDLWEPCRPLAAVTARPEAPVDVYWGDGSGMKSVGRDSGVGVWGCRAGGGGGDTAS